MNILVSLDTEQLVSPKSPIQPGSDQQVKPVDLLQDETAPLAARLRAVDQLGYFPDLELLPIILSVLSTAASPALQEKLIELLGVYPPLEEIETALEQVAEKRKSYALCAKARNLLEQKYGKKAPDYWRKSYNVLSIESSFGLNLFRGLTAENIPTNSFLAPTTEQDVRPVDYPLGLMLFVFSTVGFGLDIHTPRSLPAVNYKERSYDLKIEGRLPAIPLTGDNSLLLRLLGGYQLPETVQLTLAEDQTPLGRITKQGAYWGAQISCLVDQGDQALSFRVVQSFPLFDNTFNSSAGKLLVRPTEPNMTITLVLAHELNALFWLDDNGG